MKNSKQAKPIDLMRRSEAHSTLSGSTAIDKKSKLSVIESIYQGQIKKIKRGEPTPIYKNLFNIVCDTSVLTQAYTNLRSNKGATTPGMSPGSLDGTSTRTIAKLITSLKDGSYKPSPVKQVMIPKPGKKKLRPLRLADFQDKVVGESLRMILNSIYDPIFDSQKVNFGFRPNHSPQTALKGIQFKLNGLDHVIEGHIEAPYPSLDHAILMQLLTKQIKCKKTLHLIHLLLKAGIFCEDEYIFDITGVPQGPILSPILWNIYFMEFDEYVRTEIKELIDTKNYNALKT